MKKIAYVSEEMENRFDLIRKSIRNLDPVLDYVTGLARESGLVVLVGFNTERCHWGLGEAQWEYVYQCSKPRPGYLRCLGDIYKVYPDGRVIQTVYRGRLRYTNRIREAV